MAARKKVKKVARRSKSVRRVSRDTTPDMFIHPAPLMITVLIILIPLLVWVVRMQVR
ncbi:MAG: hypothetical protein NUV52_02055 [Candidatus Roizmanbacteria bacterium]|nr:hypothetical protein [Candidatus Roizmanbacteria bacterium]